MSYFALVTEQSRKAKAIRQVYEHLRNKSREKDLLTDIGFEDVKGAAGVWVDPADRYRILNIRLHDEHLSPYFQTNMNLFQLLMLDDQSDMSLYRSDRGWLLVFEDIPSAPQPFGQHGFDMR